MSVTNKDGVMDVDDEARVGTKNLPTYYNMNHRNRGVALIFNHEKFNNGKPRPGTNVDRDNLKTCLEHKGFEVRIKDDLPYEALISEIQKVTKEDHTNNDCLLIVILSHGDLGKVSAKDKVYNLAELWPYFEASRCPSLAGKPKLFFIQACQGKEADEGVLLRPRIETDGHSSEKSHRISPDVDFFIALSTVPNYVACRDSEKGSWFIQALCEELKMNGNSLNIFELLTLALHQVAIDYEGWSQRHKKMVKQMPYFVSTLTRLVVFHAKPNQQ